MEGCLRTWWGQYRKQQRNEPTESSGQQELQELAIEGKKWTQHKKITQK